MLRRITQAVALQCFQGLLPVYDSCIWVHGGQNAPGASQHLFQFYPTNEEFIPGILLVGLAAPHHDVGPELLHLDFLLQPRIQIPQGGF